MPGARPDSSPRADACRCPTYSSRQLLRPLTAIIFLSRLRVLLPTPPPPSRPHFGDVRRATPPPPAGGSCRPLAVPFAAPQPRSPSAPPTTHTGRTGGRQAVVTRRPIVARRGQGATGRPRRDTPVGVDDARRPPPPPPPPLPQPAPHAGRREWPVPDAAADAYALAARVSVREGPRRRAGGEERTARGGGVCRCTSLLCG